MESRARSLAGLLLCGGLAATVGCGASDSALRATDASRGGADVAAGADRPEPPVDQPVTATEDVIAPQPDVVAPPVDAGARDAGAVDASTAVSGLPCEVSRLLSTWCTSCHSNPPRSDAPQPLLTRADLVAPSGADPSRTLAQQALVRMRDAMDPMPPGPNHVPADQIAAFERWVMAGSPPGTCASTPDPLNAAPRCTSNLSWFLGNSLGDSMNPGEACIACHTSRRRGPNYQIAGTVYPSGHEPALCIPPINSAAGVTIEITDANGRVTNLTTNLVGNFHWSGTLALPYTARLITRDGRERRMIAPQRSGDCNSCHTPAGTMDAPGRITLPL